jgi:hypothetical protein
VTDPLPPSLERLRALAPPPDTPLEAGTPEDWPTVEAQLGTCLPEDYKRFTNLYGSGKFDDFLYLFNPFAAPDSGGNLVTERDRVLAGYRELRAKFPGRFPLPPFPEPGGLLPLGRSDNGNQLYWVTEGDPDGWGIALFDGRGSRYERFPPPVTGFLAGLLAGELRTTLLPAGFLDQPKHAFEPST